MKLKKIIRKLLHKGGSYYCVACDSKVKFFNKIGDAARQEINSIENTAGGFQTLNMDAYYCPICGANDRDRLLLSYLLQSNYSNKAILEIAPSDAIRNKLLHQQCDYRCCDLYMPKVDDVCDITDMKCYVDATFDVVICSHVLEHIHADDRAASEIARILKPNGKALILVPIPLGLENNFYDPDVTDPAERIKYYGQNDHVRMYSKSGLVKLIANAGLRVETWDGSKASFQFEEYGLSATSTLYLAVKS